MPFSPSTTHPSPEAAISAFLHGIERRAWVFARAQCGDEDLAEAAVAGAIDEFQRVCAVKPLASWPRDFWTLLLAQPLLLRGRSNLLPELSVGPRAALLLRLVAGLDLAHAAQVLGVSEAAYRAALSHALQQMHAAGSDPARLEGLREQLHQEIRQAPSLLSRFPSTPAVQRVPAAITPADDDLAAFEQPRWRLALKISLALLLLMLAVSFFWTPWHRLAPGESESLPPEEITIAPADASATVTHPDFALLATPADGALAGDLAFYSWLAAGGQAESATAPAPANSLAPAASAAVALPSQVQPPAAPASSKGATP